MVDQKPTPGLPPYHKRYRLPHVVIRLKGLCEFLWFYLMMASLSTWGIAISMFNTIRTAYLANVHSGTPLTSSFDQILGALSNTSVSRISHGIGIIYAVLFILVNTPISLYGAWVSSKISILSFSGHFIFSFIHSGPDVFDGLLLASGFAVLLLIAWQFVARVFVKIENPVPTTSNDTKSSPHAPKEPESKPAPLHIPRSNKPPGAAYVTVRPKDQSHCGCCGSKSRDGETEAVLVIQRLEMELQEERKRVNGSRGEWVVEREGLRQEIKHERGHFIMLQRKCKGLEASLRERDSRLLSHNREAKKSFDMLTQQAQEKYDKLLNKFKKEKAIHQRLRDSADPILQENIDLHAKLRTINASHQDKLDSYRRRIVTAETRFGGLRKIAEYWEDRARFQKERHKIFAEKVNLLQWENRRYKAVERRLRKREKSMQHALEDGPRRMETVTQLKMTVNELLPQVTPLPPSPSPKDTHLPSTPNPLEVISLLPSPPSSAGEETLQTSIPLPNSHETLMDRENTPINDVCQPTALQENPKEHENRQQNLLGLSWASVRSNMTPNNAQTWDHMSAASESPLARAFNGVIQRNKAPEAEVKVKTKPFDFEAARARILSGQAATDMEDVFYQPELPEPMKICDTNAGIHRFVEEIPMEITTLDQDQDIVLEDAFPEEPVEQEDVIMSDSGAESQSASQNDMQSTQNLYGFLYAQEGDASAEDIEMCDINPPAQPTILDFNHPMPDANWRLSSHDYQDGNVIFGNALSENIVPEETMNDYQKEERLLEEIHKFLTNNPPELPTESQDDLSGASIASPQQNFDPNLGLGGGYVNGYGDQSHILVAAKELLQQNASAISQGIPSTARGTPDGPRETPRAVRESLNTSTKLEGKGSYPENHIAGQLMQEMLQEEKRRQKATAVPGTGSSDGWDDDSEEEFDFFAQMNGNPRRTSNHGHRSRVAQPEPEDPDDNAQAEAQFLAEINELIEKQRKLTAAEEGDLSAAR